MLFMTMLCSKLGRNGLLSHGVIFWIKRWLIVSKNIAQFDIIISEKEWWNNKEILETAQKTTGWSQKTEDIQV